MEPLRIQIVKDLHCDVAPSRLPLSPDVDVLVAVSETVERLARLRPAERDLAVADE